MTILLLLLFSLLRTCPPQESIATCSCKQLGGVQVICPSLKTEAALKDALKSLQGHSVSRLTLLGIEVSTWAPDLFKGTHIHELELQKIEVDDASFRPGRRHFQGLEDSLDVLHVTRSFKNGHSLLNLQLDHLKLLKDAIFERNEIPEVGNDWFSSGPINLRTLVFEHNNIEVLGDRAFSSLVNLEVLAVAGNHLHKINRSALPSPANALRSLDLAYNKLRTLPIDLFSDMPSLVDVNLDFNLIHILQEEVFSSKLSALTNLSLDGNPLQCDKLKWVCNSRSSVIQGKCTVSGDTLGRTINHFCKA